VSKRLAEEAGLIRIDTGAMYRAVALEARRAGVSWDDAVRLGGVARDLDLSFRTVAGAPRVFLSGEDASEAIRTPEMSMGASAVSAHEPVREALVAKQREMGREGASSSKGGTPARSSSPTRRRSSSSTPWPRACPAPLLELSLQASSRSRRSCGTFSGATCRTARGSTHRSGGRRRGVYRLVDPHRGRGWWRGCLAACRGPAMTKKVLIAKSAGFCFGVKRAIAIADETAGKREGGAPGRPHPVAGPIIHNPQAVERLQEKGVRRCRNGRRHHLREGDHPLPRCDPFRRAALEGKGVTIVDATCPFVTKPRSTRGP